MAKALLAARHIPRTVRMPRRCAPVACTEWVECRLHCQEPLLSRSGSSTAFNWPTAAPYMFVSVAPLPLRAATQSPDQSRACEL